MGAKATWALAGGMSLGALWSQPLLAQHAVKAPSGDTPAAFPCKSRKEVLLQEAREDYRKFYPHTSYEEREIRGRRVQGTPEELRALEQSLGSKPPQAWRSDTFRCSVVVDCLDKLLGNRESAYRVLNMVARTGYAPMLSQFLNPAGHEQLWKVEELRQMDWAFQAVPSQFYRLPTLQQIYRKTDGYRSAPHKKNVAAFASSATFYDEEVFQPENLLKLQSPYGTRKKVTAAGIIMSYDAQFKAEPDFALATYIHELGHHVDYSLDATKSLQFQTFLKEEGAVSGYGKTDIQEAFAELFAEYVTSPEMVAVKTPKQYAFMKSFIETRGTGRPHDPLRVDTPEINRNFPREWMRTRLLAAREGSLDLKAGASFNTGFHNERNENERLIDVAGQVPSLGKVEGASDICRAAARLANVDTIDSSDIDFAMRQQARAKLAGPRTLLLSLARDILAQCRGGDACFSAEAISRAYDAKPIYRELEKNLGPKAELVSLLQNSPFANQAQCEASEPKWESPAPTAAARQKQLGVLYRTIGSFERLQSLACAPDRTGYVQCYTDAQVAMLKMESPERVSSALLGYARNECFISLRRFYSQTGQKPTPQLLRELDRMRKSAGLETTRRRADTLYRGLTEAELQVPAPTPRVLPYGVEK